MNINKTKGISLFVLPVFLLALLSAPPCFAQEVISISTYFPAPYGIYFELRTARLAVGGYYKAFGAGCYAWGGAGGCTTISANATMVVDGIVGLGTVMPNDTDGTRLHVAGGHIRIENGYGLGDPTGKYGIVPRSTDNKLQLVVDNKHAVTFDANTNAGFNQNTPLLGATPVPNGINAGNIDANDVWLRSVNKWASQISGKPTMVQTADCVDNVSGTKICPIALANPANSYCFLSYTYTGGCDTGQSCRVVWTGGQWQVESRAFGDCDKRPSCAAICIQF